MCFKWVHTPSTIIYTLELMGGKWYVGKTTNMDARLSQHFQGQGSAWTKKYQPVRVAMIAKCDSADPFAEDNQVLMMMVKYGIHNVRGGSYSQVVLNRAELSVLNRQLASAFGGCFRCGRRGHYIANCYARYHTDGTHLPSK